MNPHINLQVGEPVAVSFTVGDSPHLSLGGGPIPDYHGEYEVTPTQETQVLHTAGERLLRDVVVNPIPSNYGLITWNGSVLTIS